MSKVIVVGGGAAGMMAAISASSIGHEVTLIEQNEKLGKKIFITGKGRCNFTNASSMDEIMKAVVTNPKFLYSAFYSFDNEAVMDFFECGGMPYKIERGNRVFPQSDHAADVIDCLVRQLKENQVTIMLHTKVEGLVVRNDSVEGVRLSNKRVLTCDNVIVATGGMSYQTTGSTGDGYKFASSVGHTVLKQRCALVPLTTKESYIPLMQGLSLKNVQLSIFNNKKKVFEEFGEMMFTHFGITGPLVLSASSYISSLLPADLEAYIDLKPALDSSVLDERLLREFSEHPNSHLKMILKNLLPAKMIPVMMDLLQIDEHKPMNEVTKEERDRMVKLLKAFPLTITATRGFNEAIVTQGGVNVKEIDPSTMESKKIAGLFFVGEVLDLDALTGGFNLQIAWSTGYLAGLTVR